MTRTTYTSTQGAGVDQGFFNGRIYPLLVALITLIGFYFRIDYLTNILLIFLMLWGLFRANTLRPLFPYLFCIFYQMPRGENHSESLRFPYLLSGWRLYILIPSLAILTIGTFAYLFRIYRQNRKEAKLGVYQKNTLPLLLPTLLFCGAMFLGGYGAMESYGIWDFLFPLGQLLSYLVIFIIIYRGIEREHTEEILSYIAYVTMITSWVLVAEFGYLYLSHAFDIGGYFNNNMVSMGFGKRTLVAYHFVALIPMQLYGFAKCRGGLIYLVSAIATCAAMLATFSRNGALMGTASILFCLLYITFSKLVKGKRKIFNSIFVILVFLGTLAVGYKFLDKITILIQNFSERGFSDSFRFEQWERCIDAFLEKPLFGLGFYCFEPLEGTWLSTQFSPCMSHNTIFELMAKTGAVGLACYLIYRICTLCVFFRRKDENKRFLFFVCLPLLLMSLLDNFMFQMFTTFHYTTALAIACKIDTEQHMYSGKNNFKI